MICMSLVIDRIQKSLPFPEGAVIMSPTLEKDTEQETEDRLYTHFNPMMQKLFSQKGKWNIILDSVVFYIVTHLIIVDTNELRVVM